MTVDAPRSARAQLAALAADPTFPGPWPHARGALEDGARAAAVLILFGVLDGLPADHDAQHLAVSHDLDVLLLRRAATLTSHAGQVAFPGGRLDPGEDAVTAALREAQEETGVDPSGVRVLGPLTALPMPVSNHVVTPVLAWWEAPTPVDVVDVGESSAVFRAPVADLLDPANRYTSVLRRRSQTWRGPAWVITVDGVQQLVWGFTAGVLDALFTHLRWDEPWDRSRELEIA
ncbi:NUDIX hydrolase [Xylanimonas cellulosilytica DSM 15894]|uniref:NUDIX hydrolase n=1 Tax=Xylanimonas cellulosilytica (strain DSM 15894 / JCM 12276 / CECT 5975 / KCTC 9989 / LMG 20990 / NBRC 107835 / XIL07) TaxID=446471 RepID=D1BT78_XYLCX|nr:CoA pyrophosphatase [Xylanimonas cellulosilytica]ACZ30920.1 NUDIX hydrolase [Xylanimonas cellulosilytica DSM 15894]